MAELMLDGVRKGYGSRCVIFEADAEFHAGVHIIEGANGTGKSTLLSLLAGISSPTAGRVLLNGIDVSRLPPETKSRTGFCPAESAFFEGSTVLAAVTLYLSLQGRFSQSDPLETYDPFALKTVADVPFGHLSLGWRKRLMLHMAIACATDLLILDEPTVGLDATSVQILAALLSDAPAGRVTVLTCHEPAVLGLTADRYVLDIGANGSFLRSHA